MLSGTQLGVTPLLMLIALNYNYYYKKVFIIIKPCCVVECVLELVEYNGVEWLVVLDNNNEVNVRTCGLKITQVPMYASEEMCTSV